MAALCKLLIQTQICIFLLLLTNKLQVVHSQEDKTSFTFDTFLPKPVDLTYQGHVTTRDPHLLRLTKLHNNTTPAQQSVGRVLYSKPVQFWKPGKQANFETTFTFYIFRDKTEPADGVTFFIAPVNSTIPHLSQGCNLGIFGLLGNNSNLFAVEFDSFPNTPWDPPYPHIGIDINSWVSKNATQFDDLLGKEVIARIKYEATTREISVVATTNMVAASSSSSYYSVRYSHNLKNILHQQVQVGISAATGYLAAHHELSFWSFTSTLVNDTIGENNQENDAYI